VNQQVQTAVADLERYVATLIEERDASLKTLRCVLRMIYGKLPDDADKEWIAQLSDDMAAHLRKTAKRLQAPLAQIDELRAENKRLQANQRASAEALANAYELAGYLRDAREWSARTFGPGRRTLGVTKHIEKEIAEVRAKPDDLTEWVDIIILACDGYWRHGGQPESLLPDMLAKLAKNKARTWPAPTSEDEPTEHVRGYDADNPELGPAHREYWVRLAEINELAARDAAQQRAGAVKALRRVADEIKTGGFTDGELVELFVHLHADAIERGEVQP